MSSSDFVFGCCKCLCVFTFSKQHQYLTDQTFPESIGVSQPNPWIDKFTMATDQHVFKCSEIHH